VCPNSVVDRQFDAIQHDVVCDVGVAPAQYDGDGVDASCELIGILIPAALILDAKRSLFQSC